MGILYVRPALRQWADPGLALAGGGGGFVGAYDDIPNIAAAYGMRRLLTSYESNLLRIRRNSDQTAQDFGYDANGDLDVAAIATFLSATTGQIVTWYDQSGNGRDFTQATAASQPLYVASGQNGKPVLRFDDTDDSLTATMTIAQPLTMHAVAKTAASAIANNTLLVSNSGGLTMGLASLDRWNAYAGTDLLSTATADAATWYVHNQVLNSTSSVLRINGTQVAAGNAGTNGIPTSITISRQLAGARWNSDLAELVIASAAWDTATLLAAESAVSQYWGVPP